MKVSEVMSRGVDPLSPSATVQDSAQQMAEFDVGAVLIGSEDVLLGILTDRDIILRVVIEGTPPADVKVGDVMSSTLFTCREDDTVESAFRQMQERQIRRLPVLGESGQLLGVVTLGDLSRRLGDREGLAEALRDITDPHRNREAPENPEQGQAQRPS